MPYDEALAERLRRKLAAVRKLQEKKMFGGIAFLVNGNMAIGVHKSDLIVRVPPDEHPAALKRPGAKPFDLTGRPMAGWVLVSEKSLGADKDLQSWIELALSYVKTLPAK